MILRMVKRGHEVNSKELEADVPSAWAGGLRLGGMFLQSPRVSWPIRVASVRAPVNHPGVLTPAAEGDTNDPAETA